jgi:glucosamine-6-phosphate deaminase
MLLDETTKAVGQKYFSGKVVLSKGISLGIRYIMESKTVILQISGSRKAEIAKRLIDSEITNSLPATVLKSHQNAFLMLDKEAVGRI